MVHCNSRGAEVIVGDQGHIFKYECAGAATVAGISLNKVKNLPDGTLCLKEVEENIRGQDIHEPITNLVVIENTHNIMGGTVLPLDFIENLSKLCKKHSIKIHMDGARVFNAAEYLKHPVSRIVRDVDSVGFCLSKGLSCPVGSVLMGTKDFIDQARRLRKALGGGMRQ
jgi:threonine aldolase